MKSPLPSLIRKELRALLPAWTVAMTIVVVGGRYGDTVIGELSTFGYLVGSFMLGGLAFGHEYLNGTMPLLLTQPVARRQIYLAKMAALALLLGTLTAAAYWVFLGDIPSRELPASLGRVMAFVFFTPLFAGTAMTLLTRSAIAGTVFSGSGPGIAIFVAVIIGFNRFGWDEAAIEQFQQRVFWGVLPVYWALCALAGWRGFRRLEATDGTGVDLNPFAWFASRTPRLDARRIHPILALIGKELHIQQIVFVLAAGYALVASVVLLGPALDARIIRILIPVSVLYAATLPLLIGALASGEERQFGTLEAQLLLPMAASRQWMVKAAVVLGLSVLLAVGLPFGVVALLDDAYAARLVEDVRAWPLALVALVLASASLYVSTLVTSGVRAMVLAVPMVFGALLLLQWSFWLVLRVAGTRVFLGTGPTVRETALTVLAGSLMAFFLWLGLQNHRTTEVSFARAMRQLPWVAAFVVLASCVMQML